MAGVIDALLLLATVSRQEIETEPLDMAHVVGEALSRLSDAIAESHAEVRVPSTWPLHGATRRG
jgi:light-regulated signal transduction histidine kinase (bacteriophytochrome)